jgi:hypothetical protein
LSCEGRRSTGFVNVKSPDNAVDKAIGCQPNDWKIVITVPEVERNCFLLQIFQTVSEAHPAPYSMGMKSSSSMLKSRNVKLTTELKLALKLKIHGSILPLIQVLSSRRQRKILP